jgi:hypothetical protein
MDQDWFGRGLRENRLNPAARDQGRYQRETSKLHKQHGQIMAQYMPAACKAARPEQFSLIVS